MAIVNDNPTEIYIRHINEMQAKCFSIIKKKFGLNSNNQVVKSLFVKYLDLEKERDNLLQELRSLREEKKDQDYKIGLLKETFQVLKSL